jgi:hypothetical protein
MSRFRLSGISDVLGRPLKLLILPALCGAVVGCSSATDADHLELQVFLRVIGRPIGPEFSRDTVFSAEGAAHDIVIHGVFIERCRIRLEPVAEQVHDTIEVVWQLHPLDDEDCPAYYPPSEYEAYVYPVLHGQYTLRVLYEDEPDSPKFSGTVTVGG